MTASAYKPEYCQMLVAHMAQGYSFESFGADCDSGVSTLYAWVQAHEEFKAAKQKGYSIALKYWETLHKAATLKRGKIKLPDGTTENVVPDKTMVIFTLKTRFHKQWGEALAYKFDPEDQDDVEFDFGIAEKS